MRMLDRTESNWIPLDLTESDWIPQALPNWSTPPASGWLSQCRWRQDQMIIHLFVPSIGSIACFGWWQSMLINIQIDNPGCFRLTRTTGTSASTTKLGCSRLFCPKWSISSKQNNFNSTNSQMPQWKSFSPGVEQHDQPEEWAESTDWVPLQVLSDHDHWFGWELESLFIVTATGSRRRRIFPHPSSLLEGLCNHYHHRHYCRPYFRHWHYHHFHDDNLSDNIITTGLLTSCSAMIETLEECVERIEAAGAKVRSLILLTII